MRETKWLIRCRRGTNIFRTTGRPKRILALDGGGLRGILTLGYLKKIGLEFNPSMQHIDRMLLRDS
jgi:hypothetical protein